MVERQYFFDDELRNLETQTFDLERAGKKNPAAHEILAETRWLMDCMQDGQRITDHLIALRAALADPAMFETKDEQSPEDGSWGKWYTEWFFKLDDSHDHISDLVEDGKVLKYPVLFRPDQFAGKAHRALARVARIRFGA